MEITVKYFGMIADITQKKEEVFFVEEAGILLEKIQLKIEMIYPKILNIKYSICLNKQLITNCEVVLNDKDEVALLPPFAGG